MTTTELVAVAGTKSPERIADVVFVHGLDGNHRSTWQFEDWEESFWPRLLHNDVPQVGVWSFGYDAASSNWLGSAMPIVDRATNFAAFLRSEGIGDRPLFFVAHSLGGLIVKQMLRSRYDQDHDDPFVANTKAVFFFATPHAGSPIANYMKWLGLYRTSQLVPELEFANAPLRDLNAWFRANSTRLGIETVVFAEMQKTKNLVLVVDQVSSDPGITGVVPIPIDADHVEICKIDTDNMAFKTVRKRLQDFIRDSASTVDVEHNGPLWLDVSCVNTYPEQWEERNASKPSWQTLEYKVSREEGLVRISPSLPYLTQVQKGEPVWSVEYMWMPFRWLPLHLDLKMLNRSEETIYLTQIDLRVDESVPDLEPLLLVKTGGLFPWITLKNEGWSDVRGGTLRVALANGGAKPEYPSELPHHIDVPDFVDETEVDLTEFFALEGVDVDAVLNRNPAAALGPFSSRIAYVYGELAFEAPNVGQRKFRFGTALRLEGPMYGMFGPPTFEYQARLRTEGANYSVPVEISQVIRPGESDRVLLQLDVEKSSRHRFRIAFKGSSRDLYVNTPVEVSMFVPRSVASALREPETDPSEFDANA